jgi:endonuclease/exonuclease/phosphatase (EEP) superfamily protein YafD
MSAVAQPATEPAGGAPEAARPAAAGGGRARLAAARLLVGAAAGWLLLVVAHRLLSGVWWLWLLPELIPPLAFLVVPLLLLAGAGAVRRVRRATALLALAGLALGAGLSGVNPWALAGAEPAPPDALRVVSWNTTVWNHDDDPDRFYAMLTASDADVYLLQEYKPHDDPAVRDADLARLRAEFPGYQLAAVGELVTLSRHPIVAVTPLPVAPPPGADWQTEYWEVKTLRTDLRVGGRILSVYNAHILVPLDLSSPLSTTFYDLRREFFGRRQDQYRGLVADLAGNPGPVLLAGDLNTSPAMGDLADLTGRLRDAARAGGSAYPVSWSAASRLELWRLDWAFVSDAVRVHGYQLRDARGMSDHRLQELRISLAGAA